ncbi:MAG TPA: hypothetical protein VFP87_07770 [Chitinophagaceae bacterium]|nr:hypothetical protein [Chitinophagaceae bacterium]
MSWKMNCLANREKRLDSGFKRRVPAGIPYYGDGFGSAGDSSEKQKEVEVASRFVSSISAGQPGLWGVFCIIS